MSDATLDKLLKVVADFFHVSPSEVHASTTAADVDGWDSVSQATLVFEIEDRFDITLDFKETLDCGNLLELADLIDRYRGEPLQAEVTKESIVMFGNCQAESLAACMQHHPSIASRYTMHFVQSYTVGGDEEKTSVSGEVLSRCTLLMEQLTPNVKFNQKDQLPDGCRIVTFPSLDFNLLWPLHASDPRNRPEPGFPFGRYSYGDRIINFVVGEGLTGDAAWEAYRLRSAEALKNVLRLEAIERERWNNLDNGLSVQMGREIFARFRKERLFYTYNHPSSRLLCRLGVELLRAAGLVGNAEAERVYEELVQLFSWEFGTNYAVPIHPSIAKIFGLEWWSSDMKYRRYDEQKNYEESIRGQIDWA